MRNHFYFVVVQLHTLEEDHTDSSIVPHFVCFFLFCTVAEKLTTYGY